MIFKERASYREVFLFSAFIILFFFLQFNAADNPFPLEESTITHKSIKVNHKILTNHEINVLEQPSDICKARGGLDLNISDKQSFLFHLNGYVETLSDIEKKQNCGYENLVRSINIKLNAMRLAILTFLFSWIALKLHSIKMEPIVFVITLFSLVNPVYLVGPLFFTPTVVNADNNGGTTAQYQAIDAVKSSGYCLLGGFENPDTSVSFSFRKYGSDGTLISSVNRGSLASSYSSSNYFRSIFYRDGKCKGFYPTNSGSTNYVKFYNGVSSSTDVQAITGSQTRINKAIVLTDGSYICVGYYGLNGYIFKVNSANVPTYATDSNTEYRVVVQYDANTLWVFIWHTVSNTHFMKPISTSLSIGTQIACPFDNTYNIQDAILSGDNNLMVVGGKTTTNHPFMSKTATTGSHVWYITFVVGGQTTAICIIKMSDGSYITGDSQIVAGNQIPFIASVSDSGAINWEASYTFSPSAFIVGLSQMDDYSVTMIGGATVSGLAGHVCSPGNYRTSPTTCAPCAAGSYSTTSTDTCTLCSVGYIQPLAGQTSCVACPINTVINNVGATSCAVCRDTEYQCSTGQISCYPCIGSHCGVCKLHDRSLCDQLVGICWPSYDDKCANLSVTADCVAQMASICYKIWLVNGTNDTQCADFASYYNFTLMKLNASLINAYYQGDGQSFILEFDQDISQAGFIDASSVFNSSTLKWLPSSQSAQWINSKTLQVSYSPDVGIMKTLTILRNALYPNYKYAQVPVVATDFPIKEPAVSINVSIDGITTVSECDNIQLKVILLSQSIYPIQFKWDISFSTVGPGFSSSQQDDAVNYFKTFSNYSSITAINIPSNYFTKNSVLNVVLSAQTTSGLKFTSTSTQVTIKANLPSIKFTERPLNTAEFPSDSPTLVGFEVNNKKCTDNTRLLQSNSIIPVTVDFQLYSGSSSTSITTRNDYEIQIEQNIYSLYSKYQAITANFTKGFKYSLFYKLVITVTDTTTNTKISDSLIFSFYKPPITAVIDSLGGIVNALKDLTLNGGNSIIPLPEGDTIVYTWKCESTFSFLSGSTCLCPISTSSELASQQLTIRQSKIQNLCKYTYSLTVMATSTSGNKRSNTAKTEFIAYKASILSIYGKVVKGYMFNVKDIYFSTHITSTGPDTKLSFDWNLVQTESLVPSTGTKYSQKNTFICNFLKKIGIITNSSVTKDDVAIPQKYQPDYLTSMSERILGADAKTMVEKSIYTYAVTVTYPLGPSFELISYVVQPKPRKRIFKITPQSGVGMETSFSLAFSLPQTTDVDGAQYQILRRDCPSSQTQAIPVTQVFGTTNSYTGMFSPGLESCKFQVEIIVRAIEFESSIEVSNIITIKQSKRPANDVVADSLNLMKLNSKNMSPNQKLSMLGQISNIKVTDSSKNGKDAVNTILDMITDLDKPSGGVRDIMTNNQLISLFNSTSSILGNLLTTQSVNVDLAIASNVTSKISNYLNDSSSIPGGSQIVPSFLSTLSTVAQIGITSTDTNNSFYGDIHTIITKVGEIKLKDIMPGAIPFNISNGNIELVIQNSYVPTYNNNYSLSTGKGAEIGLPGNMSNTFYNAIANTTEKANNTVTIATSVTGESFNPYVDMKTNSLLNVSSINNLSSSLVDPETIAIIYKDLGAGKLSNVVNTKNQTSDIVEVSLIPLYIDKNGNNNNLNSSIDVGKLPDDKKVEWMIPTKSDPNNSIVVPMYYLDDKKVWINDGCGISPSNYTDRVKASCDNLGKQNGSKKQDINVASAIKMSADLINDVLNVLRAGNYKMLYNFGAFTSASWSGYFVLSCVAAFIIFTGYLVWFLDREDDWVLFEERIITLEERYGDKKAEISGGIMTKVFTFYSQVRKKGMNNVAKNTKEQNAGTTANEEKEQKIPNGFSVLTKYEEKKLKRTYDFYAEHSSKYPNKFFFLNYSKELSSNNILRRLTQARLNDDIIAKPVTFWRILKVNHCFKLIERSHVYKRRCPT